MLSFRFDDDHDTILYQLAQDAKEEENQDFIIQKDTNIDYITEDMCYNEGIDMQGIEWSKEHITRDQYREYRNKGFKSYLSCKEGEHDLRVEQQIKKQKVDQIADNEEFYTFNYSRLREPCSIGHFQLRNLVSVTNKNSVYYMHRNSIKQWSPQKQSSQTVLDLPFIKVTSMSCQHGILLVGGFEGECIFKNMENNQLPLRYYQSQRDLGIINHVDIIKSNRTGVLSAMISSNNNQINIIHIETLKSQHVFELPFAVNCSSVYNDLLCIVGDTTETQLLDIRSHQKVASIQEHHDYSFACAWRPNGLEFATGNQDQTTRVYDIRNTSRALHVLGANLSSISSLTYSKDGHYLMASESVDFVHLYETDHYESSQVIDMFGDIAGVGLSPDDQTLYIANTDEHRGGMFEFQRIQQDPVYYF